MSGNVENVRNSESVYLFSTPEILFVFGAVCANTTIVLFPEIKRHFQ
jgi:hypothetical protein